MVEFENLEEIKAAIERLENHGQYYLGDEDLHALNILIEAVETVVQL